VTPSSTRLRLSIQFKRNMKRSGDSTHPSWSPAQIVNSCDLTPPTRTQTSEQEYSDLTASNRRLSRPYSRNPPKAFHEEPGRVLPRGRKNMCRRLWHTPKISRNLLESENLVCSATARTKIGLCSTIQL